MRILCTAMPAESGEVRIGGFDLRTQAPQIRHLLGVVFQSPSLDGKLTVMENMLHQGRLYGLRGKALREKAVLMLSKLGVLDREKSRVDTLSGGLKRRVEIAKCLLHDPKLLILDEPSTGLDPGSRHDVWQYVKALREEQGVTVLVTTHLMEEAELCTRVAIMDKGNLVALGKPEELKRTVGGDVIQMRSAEAEKLAAKLKERFQLDAVCEGDTVQVEHRMAAEFIPKLAETFASDILSLTLRRPTLGDVFMHKTGRSFTQEEKEEKK